jgi:arylsulfatase A-like enzyme
VAGRPSFVVFLTDDQGWGDLGCMGAEDLRTPHLDALAARGVRCTSWYANAPVCSPSRAALLTGRYPGRAGVRSILAGHRTATGLPREIPTLATALRPLGYRTGLFGKWHLGLAPGSRPEDHGFDQWFGFLAGCIDYYSHIYYWGGGHDPVHDLWEDGREVFHNGRYFTEMVAERATTFVDRAARDGQPFFLYVAFNAPHYPLHAPRAYLDRFPGLDPERRIMAAMLATVDDGVGQVVAALERHGLLEDTCIVFMSDNGPSRETRNHLDGGRAPYRGGRTGPFKGEKFSLFEGGIRVPGIWSWPARIPGGRVLSEPAAAIDVFPTLLRAAGGDPAAYGVDGVDLLPWLTGMAPAPARDLFWEQGGQTAIRRGRYKLVLQGQLLEGLPPEDAVHLSDLETDPGERQNLARELPELADTLRRAAEAWRAGIEAAWERLRGPGTTGYTAAGPGR